MDRIIPVISLWQPWASWIAEGYKGIETRTHTRFKKLAGQEIGIHASNKWDLTAMPNDYLSPEQSAETKKGPFGEIVCFVRVDYVATTGSHNSQAALIDCGSVFRQGLFLSPEIKKPREQLKVKGGQGIWHYDLEAKKKVSVEEYRAYKKQQLTIIK